MRIILHETPYTRQPSQSATRFITMNDTKLGHSNRELFVTPVSGIEDEAMPRAIHRLETPFLLLYVEGEHVILVVLPVTRCFPEFGVVHVGRDDLLVASFVILGLSIYKPCKPKSDRLRTYPHKLDQRVIQARSVR